MFYSFGNGASTFILLYVDDLMLVSSSRKELDRIQGVLGREFDMSRVSDLTNATFIGLTIKRDRVKGTLSISQESYVMMMLEKFNMSDCNAISTPIEPNLNLTKVSDNCDNCTVPYRELIGTLMFLARGSRPDISFSVGYFSRFMQSFGLVHWNHLRRILRYLKGTSSATLIYKRCNYSAADDISPLNVYIDADFCARY